jgi:hypothetical protein
MFSRDTFDAEEDLVEQAAAKGKWLMVELKKLQVLSML